MACVIVWFFFVFSVAVRGVYPRGECCSFFCFFGGSFFLVAVRGVFSRDERYSHFCFVFPNAPARVTNFREPAGLAVIYHPWYKIILTDMLYF